MNQSISWAGSLELFPIFTSAEILWKSGFEWVSRLELRWERIVSHQRTLIWLRCDGSAHWIIEQPQSFHCLRIRFDSLSFPVALSTIDDWVTLEVHYPLWPTLRLSDSLVYCRQLPWNLLGYFSVLNIHRVPDVPEQAIGLSPPAFNIHWIPDVPEEAIRLSPPRSTFTESPTFPSKLLGYLPRVHSPNFGMYLCVQFDAIPQNHCCGFDTPSALRARF